MSDDYKVPGNKKVTPPTNEDMYDTAADAVTDWTSKVNPTPRATDSMPYKDDPTKKPHKYDNDGVTSPTNEDIYVTAADEVTDMPEIALDDSKVQAENQEKEDEQFQP